MEKEKKRKRKGGSYIAIGGTDGRLYPATPRKKKKNSTWFTICGRGCWQLVAVNICNRLGRFEIQIFKRSFLFFPPATAAILSSLTQPQVSLLLLIPSYTEEPRLIGFNVKHILRERTKDGEKNEKNI